MKRFNYTELWVMLHDFQRTTGGSIQQNAAFDEFMTELHEYCRQEKDPAERTRTLRFARTELAIAQEQIHNGAEKKCAVTGNYCPFRFAY